jgi:MFS family permease
MVSRIPSGRLADKVGYKLPIMVAFVLLAAAFLALAETSSTYLLGVAMIVYGAAHGMRAVSEWTMLGDHAPLAARNVATAYLSTIFNVGGAFGAVTAGALSVVTDIPSMFRVGSVIVLSGAIIVIAAARKGPRL